MQPSQGALIRGDVWRQHEGDIRKLYQEDRRTLEEVKRLMEAQGFPVAPLWTWETKLRDLLGLRKKAKRGDWPLLYQHICRRLEHPDRKAFKKPTVIYFNGTEYSWDRAWKEIRRLKIPAAIPNQEPLGHLPPEFMIRTPPASPAPLSSPTLPKDRQTIPEISHLRSPSPVKKRHAYFDQDTSCGSSLPSVKRQKCIENSALTRIPMPIQRQLNSLVAKLSSVSSMASSLGHGQLSPTERAASVYRLCLETIPWIDVINESNRLSFANCGSTWTDHNTMLDVVTGNSPTFVANDAMTDLFSSIGGFILSHEIQSSTAPSDSGSMGRRQSHIEASNSNQGPDPLQYLFIAVYLLSNKFLVEEHIDIENLSVILRRIWEAVPHNLLLNLFRKRLPSMTTTWETLLRCATICKHTTLFKALIAIGIQESLLDVEAQGHDHLFHAARLGCEDTVSDLVKYGCNVNLGWYLQDNSAIIAALDYCSLDCAKLLIDTDDDDCIRLPLKKSLSTNFLLFIENFEPNSIRHVAALKHFLSRGANPQSFVMPDKWSRATRFYEASTNVPQLWRPAVSDYLLYRHTSTFKKMFLKLWDQDPTAMRAGILCAAEQGVRELESFLARAGFLDSDKFLQMVLAEQFLLNLQKGINLRVVLSLVRYGVDIDLPLLSDEVLVLDLMYETVRQAKVEGFHYSWRLFLKMLLDKGAVVRSRTLRQAVQDRGCDILRFLSECGVDLGTKGAAAVVQAARLNNTQAVILLLNAGVDINSTVRVSGERLSIIAMSLVEWQFHPECYSRRLSATSCATLQLLLDMGAYPRFNEHEPAPWRLLQLLLAVSSGELRAKVRFLLDTCVDLHAHRCPSARLLEDCLRGPQDEGSNEERMEVFRDLLDRGAKVGPGSPLALLIYCDGSDDLIQRLLRGGADVNAYTSPSQERMDMPSCISPLQAAALKGRDGIFQQLLDMGADVNGRPRGFKGTTAIQAVCSWSTKTTEDRFKKVQMLQSLIHRGADVNGAPAKHWGCTALQITALQGDLEIAAMLLTHGANVNAPRCNKNDGFMALDGAAELGRLDMVKFLLNANALSFRRGRDGYEGARTAASENGHVAVVEIINKHAEFNRLYGTENPMQFLPRQSRKEAYGELDPEVDDSDVDTESNGAMELDEVSDAERFEDDVSDWESEFSAASEISSTADVIDIESVERDEDMPFQSYSGLLDNSGLFDDEQGTKWF